MSITERYPTLPGNVPPNVTRYPLLRVTVTGNAPETVSGEKRYPEEWR